MGVRTTRRVLLRGGAGASLAALAACSGDEQSGGSPEPSAAPSTTASTTPSARRPTPDPHPHGDGDPDADRVGRAEPEGRRRGDHRARGPVGHRVPAGRHGAGRRARHRPAAARLRRQRRRGRNARGAQPGRRGRRDRAARPRAASRVRDEPAPLRLPVHRRRQPDRPDDLRRHASESRSRSSPASGPRPTTTVAAWRSARTGCSTPPPAMPRTRPAPRTPARSTARCSG